MSIFVYILGLFYVLQPKEPWDGLYKNEAAAVAQAAVAAPFPGNDGWREAAATLLVMGLQESHFIPDSIGDHGASIGMWQINPDTAGVSKDDLLDYDSAAHVAIRLIHTSFLICKKRPLEERLGWYALGGSGCNGRLELSRYRMHLVKKLLRENPYYPEVTGVTEVILTAQN